MHVDNVNKFLENIETKENGEEVHDDDFIERKKTLYFSKLSFVLSEARRINDEGRFLPVWAVCLGFEAMLINDGEAHLRLNQFQDRNKNHSFKLKKTALDKTKGSFARFIKTHFMKFDNNKYFFHYHIRGFTPKTFDKDPYLKGKYNIIAVGSSNDFSGPSQRILEKDPFKKEYFEKEDIFSKLFYKDLKKNKITLNSQKQTDDELDRELLIKRIMNYKSPFKVRQLNSTQPQTSNQSSQENSSGGQNDADAEPDLSEDSNPDLKHIKTDFSRMETEFISIVENKKYPFYGMQFHPEKPLYDFHNNKYVDISEKSRRSNELLLSFFMEKVFNGKIDHLKKLLNVDKNEEGFEAILKKDTHENKFEKSLTLFSKLRDHIFQGCKITLSDNNCKKFNYSMLQDLDSNYQNSLSQQILLDYDQYFNKKFNKIRIPKVQDKIVEKRMLLRNIGVFDEILLVYQNFRG